MGCGNTVRLPFSARPAIELTLQTQPASAPGTYTLAGTTNLPDRSRIIVQGIRRLEMADAGNGELAGDPSGYAILGRQTVEANQGKWQATLKLWEVAADGSYQEAWQLQSPHRTVALHPNPNLTFLATFDPTYQPATIQEKLQHLDKELDGNMVRFTPTGQWYLEATQSLAAPLPVGGTTPPAPIADHQGQPTFDPLPTDVNPPQPIPAGQSGSTEPLSAAKHLY